MALKRSYQVTSKYTRPFKRTRAASLSRALAVRKPELKETLIRINAAINNGNIQVAPLTIARGDQSYQRIGDSVRIMSVEVIGYPAGQFSTGGVTTMIVCSKNSQPPQAPHFTSGSGSFYDMNKGWTLCQFQPLSSDGGGNNGCALGSFSKHFKMGMIQDYSDDVPQKNALWFILSNFTGAGIVGQDCHVRIRYYDV